LQLIDTLAPIAVNKDPVGHKPGADHAEFGEVSHLLTLGVVGGFKKGGVNCDLGALGVVASFGHYEPSDALGCFGVVGFSSQAESLDGGLVGRLKKKFRDLFSPIVGRFAQRFLMAASSMG
jgi:hypothetical protein